MRFDECLAQEGRWAVLRPVPCPRLQTRHLFRGTDGATMPPVRACTHPSPLRLRSLTRRPGHQATSNQHPIFLVSNAILSHTDLYMSHLSRSHVLITRILASPFPPVPTQPPPGVSVEHDSCIQSSLVQLAHRQAHRQECSHSAQIELPHFHTAIHDGIGLHRQSSACPHPAHGCPPSHTRQHVEVATMLHHGGSGAVSTIVRARASCR